jgi:uncharacterized membrane protein YoaK (UPF0700 family)
MWRSPSGSASSPGSRTCSASWPWYGLLAAHVTGNPIFLAYDITRGQYDFGMRLAALSIFAVSVAIAAWFCRCRKAPMT